MPASEIPRPSLSSFLRSIPNQDCSHEEVIEYVIQSYRLGVHDGCELERQYDAEQTARVHQSFLLTRQNQSA